MRNIRTLVSFSLANLAVLLMVNTFLRVTGLDKEMGAHGYNNLTFLAFCAVIGFITPLILLGTSKMMAKRRARVITEPRDEPEQWLLSTVGKLSRTAGISMPEVAIFDGPPNAFATGPSRNNSLVAVSTGLLQEFPRHEVEAVLAHEVSHINNGDMVTMVLIEGVVNTFGLYLSRVLASIVSASLFRNSGGGRYAVEFGLSIVFQIAFSLIAMVFKMYFSRKREFRADAGAAQLLSSPQSMIAALKRLGSLNEAAGLPTSIAAAGIRNRAPRSPLLMLFATHPPIGARIVALGGNIKSHG